MCVDYYICISKRNHALADYTSSPATASKFSSSIYLFEVVCCFVEAMGQRLGSLQTFCNKGRAFRTTSISQITSHITQCFHYFQADRRAGLLRRDCTLPTRHTDLWSSSHLPQHSSSALAARSCTRGRLSSRVVAAASSIASLVLHPSASPGPPFCATTPLPTAPSRTAALRRPVTSRREHCLGFFLAAASGTLTASVAADYEPEPRRFHRGIRQEWPIEMQEMRRSGEPRTSGPSRRDDPVL